MRFFFLPAPLSSFGVPYVLALLLPLLSPVVFPSIAMLFHDQVVSDFILSSRTKVRFMGLGPGPVRVCNARKYLPAQELLLAVY